MPRVEKIQQVNIDPRTAKVKHFYKLSELYVAVTRSMIGDLVVADEARRLLRKKRRFVQVQIASSGFEPMSDDILNPDKRQYKSIAIDTGKAIHGKIEAMEEGVGYWMEIPNEDLKEPKFFESASHW